MTFLRRIKSKRQTVFCSTTDSYAELNSTITNCNYETLVTGDGTWHHRGDIRETRGRRQIDYEAGSRRLMNSQADQAEAART
ncbi:hypothetical protein EVAR_7141_1 [Eumeta japonica]|uniref:Uncharacterized protein n=1 Tax=Eumeta variegata TaxID=151549 RepID=A0A4C1U6L2_EUMVA|nr:hypothetical protein EVAR_7141_1 [Eumeta japonica]